MPGRYTPVSSKILGTNNQILIQYNAGLNSPFSNSSSRINDITDVRALNTTYVFTYNTDPLPHLASITNPLGYQLEYYTFGYLENQTLKSPFTPSISFGRPALLQTVTSAGPNLSYQLVYNTSGSGRTDERYVPVRRSNSMGIPALHLCWLANVAGGSIPISDDAK